MKEEKLEISFIRSTLSELGLEERELISKAKDSFNSAYAPYSGFLVGTSVLLENGKIINGSNQENVAYPSGLCAERVALFYAGSRYPNIVIKTIAVSAFSDSFKPKGIISPCGACRQVMAEFQEKQNSRIRVLLHSQDDNILIIHSVEDLLPYMFKNPLLKRY